MVLTKDDGFKSRIKKLIGQRAVEISREKGWRVVRVGIMDVEIPRDYGSLVLKEQPFELFAGNEYLFVPRSYVNHIMANHDPQKKESGKIVMRCVFPEITIHTYGLHVDCLPRVWAKVDSFCRDKSRYQEESFLKGGESFYFKSFIALDDDVSLDLIKKKEGRVSAWDCNRVLVSYCAFDNIIRHMGEYKDPSELDQKLKLRRRMSDTDDLSLHVLALQNKINRGAGHMAAAHYY